MKQSLQIIRYTLFAFAMSGALAASGALSSVSAQETKEEGKQKTVVSRPRGDRDPFVKYRAPVRFKKAAATPIALPSTQERIDRYKAQKLAAMNAQMPAPKPTTALLVSEMQVVGIFRTPRGYAAMVEATPIHLSYVIYPGETFYDGQLVAIEEDRLVMRRETRWTDGRLQKVVETKPLRQVNPIVDSMAAVKGAKEENAAPAVEKADAPKDAMSVKPVTPEQQ
jgi:hypothetical protein